MANAETTAAPAMKNVLLPCPRCGEQSACISLNLFSLEDGEGAHCHECDTTWDIDEVREIMRRWAPILKWLDAMPVVEE